MVRRTVQCLVEAANEQEAEKKVKDGDYEFIDSWDEDEMGADLVSIDSIVEDTEDEI
jgi:hypothetical protein